LIKKALSLLPPGISGFFSCSLALSNTIVTQADLIPVEVKEKLALLIGRYLP